MNGDRQSPAPNCVDAQLNLLRLIEEFEQGHAPAGFHHADHVRVAFAYVTQYPFLEAVARFCAALKRFAAAQGKPQLYHETITWAYLILIRERQHARRPRPHLGRIRRVQPRLAHLEGRRACNPLSSRDAQLRPRAPHLHSPRSAICFAF